MSHSNINLPLFQYIDTTVGLKYLNGNRELYIKILENFLIRYRDIDIHALSEQELFSVAHTIKGLSATLGMKQLTEVSLNIQENKEYTTIDFVEELEKILQELTTTFNKERNRKISSILLINNSREEIDELIEILDDEYDILLAQNQYEALEIFDTEEIDLVILHKEIDNMCGIEVFNFLKKHTNIEKTSLIFITKQEYEKDVEALYHHRNISFIHRPFQETELKKQIKIFNNHRKL